MLKPKLRILIVDDQVPVPEMGFGFPRMNAIIGLLANNGFDVSFFPLNWYPGTWKDRRYTVVDSSRQGVESHLRQVSRPYDAVLISRTRNFCRFAPAIRENFSSTMIIYDVEALNSRRERLKAMYRRRNPSSETYMVVEKVERDMMEYADLVVSVSANERSIINQWGFHNVVVIGHLHNVRLDSPNFNQRRGLLIIQGCHKAPKQGTLNSVNWFLEQISPLLSPAAIERISIAGHGMTEALLHDKHRSVPGLNMVGAYPDAADIMGRHRVMAVPSRIVAGLPWKVTESMAHGLPVVSTTRVAELLQVQDDELVLLHDDDPHGFARKIENCYQDEHLWNRLQNNAYQYVRQFCSTPVLERAVTELRERIECHGRS